MLESTERNPDLAQLAAEAITCTDEVNPTFVEEFESDTDLYLGVVPHHLRHLFNLAQEIMQQLLQRNGADLSMEDVAASPYSIVTTLFHYSLECDLGYDPDKFSSVCVRTGWLVAGVQKKGTTSDILLREDNPTEFLMLSGMP